MAEKDMDKEMKKAESKAVKELTAKLKEMEETVAKQAAELEEKGKALEENAQAVAKSQDDYLRLRAEFETFRRRNAQEKLDLVSVASRETIEGLLPVLDDCERAMKVLENSDDSPAAKEGTAMIYNKLMGYLKGKGLAVIDAMGKEFDTDFHEAVAQFPVPEEDRKGKVFDVCLTGYTLNGKVIRFAKVVVGI